MKHIKIICVVFMLAFIMPMISANGLTIIDNILNINKTYDIDEEAIIKIQNTEPFIFYNVSFEDNNFIEFPEIGKINPGQIINVTAKIFGNTNFNGQVKIKGFYLSNLGVSDETYNINIDFLNGLSLCDKTLIKGDQIIWHNLVNDEVVIKNMDTNQNAIIIPINSSHTSNFDVPEVFTYAVFRRGYQFTNVCSITVLNDQGLINNPEYDSNLNLNLRISYEPTDLEINVFTRNYTMDFYEIKEGVLNIKNIGNKTSRDIHLSGSWFDEFSDNDFDLPVGEDKNILFKIKPIVFNTNETGKLYKKNLTISGNFESIHETFNVFINYGVIDGTGIIGNESGLLYLIEIYCKQHPEVCSPAPRIIYRDNNNTGSFNVTMNQEFVAGLFGYMFELGDILQGDSNFMKEQIDLNTNAISLVIASMQNLTNATTEEKNLREEQSTTGYLLIIVFLFIIIIGLMVFLIYKIRAYKKRQELERQ